jgi:large subunit ribosomal protein L21
MYAVVEIAGKQYRVEQNDLVEVDLLPQKSGEGVEFDKVLMVCDGEKKMVGTPYVENAKVEAEVVDEVKGDKVIVFKYLRKKDHRKKNGHRQKYSRVKIKNIVY